MIEISKPEATVRRAIPADASAIVRMVAALARQVGFTGTTMVTEQQLLAAMTGERPVCTVLVAEADGAVAGVSVHSVIFSTWRGMLGVYVVDLYVDEAWRRAGLGVALLRAAANAGAAEGCGYMMLDVDIDNTGAQGFYERLGFREIPRDRRHVLDAAGFAALMAGSMRV